jgi:hypothetical protein
MMVSEEGLSDLNREGYKTDRLLTFFSFRILATIILISNPQVFETDTNYKLHGCYHSPWLPPYRHCSNKYNLPTAKPGPPLRIELEPDIVVLELHFPRLSTMTHRIPDVKALVEEFNELPRRGLAYWHRAYLCQWLLHLWSLQSVHHIMAGYFATLKAGLRFCIYLIRLDKLTLSPRIYLISSSHASIWMNSGPTGMEREGWRLGNGGWYISRGARLCWF